ncbi:MAG: hypothetical protein AAF682_24015 [Planctomycetota bacterium]
MSGARLAAALLALFASAAWGQTDAGYERVQALVRERRFGAAWESLGDVGDPLLAARARADLLYFGRDFAGALDAARDGLEQTPGDLALLHRALSAALWMRDGSAAEPLHGRLVQALADAQLDEGARGWWDATAADLGTAAGDLVAGGDERAARLRRARVGTFAALSVLLGALLALALAPRRSNASSTTS